MQQSWLLRYSLLLVVATREASTYSHEAEPPNGVVPSVLKQNSVFQVVITEVNGQESEIERMCDSIANPTSVPAKREAPDLGMARPTAISSLRKRQDDGQIQALSAQLQSLSQSATRAISSVSSSASSVISQMSQSTQSIRQSADQATQSVRQSANQAVQSANQAADQANRRLSQTESSASSAVSSARSRASDDMSRSLSSMSSRLSANLASAQSSASNAISAAQAAASQFAASQIQAVETGASGVRGDANSLVDQVQSNSVSTSNIAIIITVSIVGTALLSTASTYLLLRYRGKKTRSRERDGSISNRSTAEKLTAIRGSLSPGFPRFGGPAMDGFRLPSISPWAQVKKDQNEARNKVSLAASDIGDQEANRHSRQSTSKFQRLGPLAFRLQKDNGVTSATTVRLIQVSSEKSRAGSLSDTQQTTADSIPPLSEVTLPNHALTMSSDSTSNQQTMQSSQQMETVVSRSPKSKEPPSEAQGLSAGSTYNFNREIPSWPRPTRSTTIDENRFRFRDSSDLESGESSPTNQARKSSQDTDTGGMRTSRSGNLKGQLNRENTNRTTFRQPTKTGGNFATFPRVRTLLSRESMINRGRPNLNTSISRPGGDEE
ncbi:hypothetical protein F4802DRAFT_384135 [Xylaria palmicola]|nr:hypothetical protein F4802DRAFT_384135 [Xylaria palmicola]